MNRILKRITAAVTAFAVTASAVVFDVPEKLVAAVSSRSRYDYQVDDIRGILTINSDTGMTEWMENGFMDADSVQTVEMDSNVTSIPEGAFGFCSNLTSVEIGSGVQTIDANAFYNCRSLTEITVAAGNSKYSSTDGVLFNTDKTQLICYPEGKQGSSYEIPSTVTSIEQSAFENCQQLTSVTAAAGSRLTTIKDYAFRYCLTLASITIPEGVTSLGINAFNQCEILQNIDIPASLTSMSINESNGSPFINCKNLTAINVAAGNTAYSSENGVLFNKNKTKLICCPGGTQGSYEIPNTVTSVETWAFYSCKKLTSVTIPNTVTSIGDKAFSYCNITLTSVTIPSSVTSIGNSAFQQCSKLATVTFEKVTPPTIGNTIFDGCNQLDKIMVLAGSAEAYKAVSNLEPYKDKITGTTIEGDCGRNATWTFDGTTLTISGTGAMEDWGKGDWVVWKDYRANIQNVVIQNGITSIGNYAFYSCTNLSSVTIPSSVTTIGEYAFYMCNSLTNVDFLNGVSTIGEAAFNSCTNLSSVTIPNSVTTIGQNAFANCKKLTAINVDDSNPNFSSVDGVLFNKDKTQLIRYPGGKQGSYTIPDSVTSLERNAFSSCTGFTSITIPNTVTSIGQSAFYSCSKLNEIIYKNDLDVSSASIPKTTTQVQYEVNNGKLNVTAIDFKSSGKTSVTITDAMGISSVEENLRSKVSQEGHTHIYEDLSGAETDACVICNKALVKHIHGICGVSGCTDPNHPAGHDTEITWTAISDENGLKNMADGGHYYLTKDVTLTNSVTIGGTANGAVDIALCLNGHTITAASGKRIFEVEGGFNSKKDCSLTLCDCNGTGKLTGGGVLLSGAEQGYGVYFTMYGGTISGNTVSSNGGGVFINARTTFTMNGGTISGNTVSGDGSGVYVYTGNFVMNGGTISGNTAKNGGGVYVHNSGKFTMNGGTISDNTASVNGGGVYVNSLGTTVTLNGKVDITGNKKSDDTANNVYLDSGKFLTIGESFSSASKIGVTAAKAPTGCSTGTVAVTGAVSSDISGSFTADKEGQAVVYKNSTVQLALPHNYNESWSSDNTNHYHECSVCGDKKDTAAHTWSEWTITKAPTAADTGTARRTCTEEGCTGTETKTLPKIDLSGSGSAPEGLTIETKQPTMTEAGEIKYKETETGKVVATVEIPALNAASGGTSIWTKTEVGEGADKSKNPTPTEGGTFVYTSEDYGTIEVEIPALSNEAWTKTETAKPSVSTGGEYTYTSTDYGTVTVDIPALTDTDFWTKKTTGNTEPGVNTAGSYTYTSDYGEVTVEVPVLTDETWTKTETTKPSANAGGEYTYTSDYGTVTVDVPALTDEAWTKSETTKPSVSAGGKYTYTSDDYGTVTVEVPALTDEAWTKTETAKPSVSAGGKYTYTSDEYGTVTVDVPALTDEAWTKSETTKPSVSAGGKYTYTSDEYGTVTVDVPALTDEAWTKKTTGNIEPKENTPGSYTYTSDYGEVTVEVPELSNDTVWEKTTTPATEENEGKNVYTSVYGKVEVVIPKPQHTHTLTYVPEVPATETAAGTKEHWHCDGCDKNFADENGETELTDTELSIPVIGHTHTLTYVPEVPATETAAGTKEHWHCGGCDKNFADENGETELTDSELSIPVIGHTHTLTYVPEVPATETAAGTKEHWHCDGCDKNFADENGETELTDSELSVPVIGHTHTLTYVPEVPATETAAGTKEHWHCDGCDKNFADENGETELTDSELSVPVIGHTHTLTYVPEVPATETAAGTKEHWHCGGCDKNFADKNGETELTADDLKIGEIETEVQAPSNVPKLEIATPKDELIEAALSAEEQEKVDEGAYIKIILKVEDATNSVPTDDKTAVTGKLGELTNYKLGQYLDITMLKKIGDQAAEKITQTSKSIRVTFMIPSALCGKAEYSVVRVHGGETTVLKDLDSDPNTVTIETDKFSTYALVYKEKNTPSDPGGDNTSSEEPGVSDNPPTSTPSESDNPVETTSSDENPPRDESTDTVSSESKPTDVDNSDVTSSDDGNTTPSDDDNTAPSESEASSSVSDHSPSESSPSEDNGNPSTGIAVSLIPLAAAAVLMAAAKHKKK